MENYSTFIAMDVHKNSIPIAIAKQGRSGEVLSLGIALLLLSLRDPIPSINSWLSEITVLIQYK